MQNLMRISLQDVELYVVEVLLARFVICPSAHREVQNSSKSLGTVRNDVGLP